MDLETYEFMGFIRPYGWQILSTFATACGILYAVRVKQPHVYNKIQNEVYFYAIPILIVFALLLLWGVRFQLGGDAFILQRVALDSSEFESTYIQERIAEQFMANRSLALRIDLFMFAFFVWAIFFKVLEFIDWLVKGDNDDDDTVES